VGKEQNLGTRPCWWWTKIQMGNPNFIIILFFLISTALSLKAAPDAAKPVEALPMRYRMIDVTPDLWCDPARQDEVKALTDRLAASGFNAISIGSYKFIPIYFVDYSQTKYPEAQEYSSETVAQNVKTLRENIRYAKSKGIKWFVARTQSFYAPYNFWKVHQAELNPDGIFNTLLAKAHQSDIYSNTLAGKDNIIPQQQWSNPCWRQFFLDSTRLTLDALPELDGFMNAYAEAAWTYDTNKLKENHWNHGPDYWDIGNWEDFVDYPQTEDCFVDYADSLYQMLKEKRGDTMFFGLRDWYITPQMLKRLQIPPQQLVISIKYAGYDQPLINYPPWGKSLLDDGYSVMMDIHEFTAEHPHPIYWYNHDIITETFSNIIAARFAGVVYDGFPTRKPASKDPIALLTDEAVVQALDGKNFTDAKAVKFLKPYYRDGARDLLLSLTKVGIAQEALIKLCPAWFWQGDGLTPGGPQTLKFWQLVDNPDAPPGMAFVRQDVIGVPEYAAKVVAGHAALQKALQEWKREGKKTPYDVIDLMLGSADDAVKAMVAARKKAPANAPFIQDLVASSVIHKEMVLRDVAFIKAGLAYFESGGQYDGRYDNSRELKPTGMDKKDECMKELSAILVHDLILKKLCLEYAPRRPTTREKPGYTHYREIAAVLGKQLDIPAMDTNELTAMTQIITTPAK